MSDPTPRLNNIKDVVERTRLSRSTIYQQLSCGRLRSLKVGSRRLVVEEALVEFIRSLAEGSTATGNTVVPPHTSMSDRLSDTHIANSDSYRCAAADEAAGCRAAA